MKYLKLFKTGCFNSELNLISTENYYVIDFEKIVIKNFVNLKNGTYELLNKLNYPNITININNSLEINEFEILKHLLDYIEKNEMKFNLVIKSNEKITLNKNIMYISKDIAEYLVDGIYVHKDEELVHIIDFKFEDLIDRLIELDCSEMKYVKEAIYNEILLIFKINNSINFNIKITKFEESLSRLLKKEWNTDAFSMLNVVTILKVFNDTIKILKMYEEKKVKLFINFNDKENIINLVDCENIYCIPNFNNY